MEAAKDVIISWAGAIIVFLLGLIAYLLKQREARQKLKEERDDEKFQMIGEALAGIKTMLAVHDMEIRNMKEDRK